MSLPRVLLEQSGVVAIHKPAGLATQAPSGIASVEGWLRDRLGRGDDGYLGIPHRLDRAVSGVLLLAITPRATRKLSRQFERREVKKTYLAVVEPVSTATPPPAGAIGEWRDFLRKIPEEARSEIVSAASPGAREAVTAVHRQATVAGTVLRLEPHTGRMHQLRLQAASRGLPIVGDELYGGRPLGGGDVRERPILLHAWRIAYADPDSGERVEVEAAPPDHWPEWARPA